MHFSTIIVAALAAITSASPAVKRADCPEVDNIPVCGYPCILSAVTQVGCATDDYACMCGQFDQVQAAAVSCVLSNCGLAGAPAVLTAAQAVCAACA